MFRGGPPFANIPCIIPLYTAGEYFALRGRISSIRKNESMGVSQNGRNPTGVVDVGIVRVRVINKVAEHV